MERLLVLVRHGESEWNKLNLFTGWEDVGLTERGIDEAKAAGQRLKGEGLTFDIGFTSLLQRASRTLDIILVELGQSNLPIMRDKALNERSYGELVGLNKSEAKDRFGAAQVHAWRRSYDIAPPGGESLKDTKDRVVPYYEEHIWPELDAGKRVIVSAHGNSLRALIMRIEELSPDEVRRLNLATGVPMVYRIDRDGVVQKRRELAAWPAMFAATDYRPR